MKKATPPAENGRPNMPPENAMNRGQSRPSSKDRTVPETAPTAKRMPNALDPRRASSIQASSRRQRASASATHMSSGSPTPRTAKTMWNPSEVPIVALARVALSKLSNQLAHGTALGLILRRARPSRTTGRQATGAISVAGYSVGLMSGVDRGQDLTPSGLPRTISNPEIGDVLTFVEVAGETAGKRLVLEVPMAPGGG